MDSIGSILLILTLLAITKVIFVFDGGMETGDVSAKTFLVLIITFVFTFVLL
jgi:hypothetical protein